MATSAEMLQQGAEDLARAINEEKDVTEKVDMLLLATADMQRTLSEILTLVAVIKEEVGPVIESLASSPIFKMLGGK